VDAGTARDAILGQHQKIRALLARAEGVAEAALDGTAPRPDAVASAIGDIRLTMEVHLAFEEAVLLPLLEKAQPLGRQRADHLRNDHARQRAMMAAIHDEAVAHPDLPTLAVELAYLSRWLLADMEEEERSLVNR
jgi:hypothetical protein